MYVMYHNWSMAQLPINYIIKCLHWFEFFVLVWNMALGEGDLIFFVASFVL